MMKNKTIVRWWFVVLILLGISLVIATWVIKASICVGGDRPWWC